MNWDKVTQRVTQSRYRHAAAEARQRRFPRNGISRAGKARALATSFIDIH